jgi:hypothetical protein
MRCEVVPFRAGKSAAATRRSAPATPPRDDLVELVNGLQVLALTRPLAIIVIKKLVLGLLTTPGTGA